jgi:hypothetical protein
MTDSPYRVDFEALCKELEQRGIDVGINPVRAAIAAIDYLRQQRDSAEAMAQAAAEDYNRARDELEELTAGGLPLEQEIRARAALAAHPPFGMKNRLDVIDEIAAYIRDGSRKDLASFQVEINSGGSE